MNARRSRHPLTRLTLLLCMALLLMMPVATLLAAHAQMEDPTAISARPAGNALVVDMARFGDKDGYTLKTVRTERVYSFTRPKGWKVLPSSTLNLAFQHSPALLPERSSLNVLVNNRILKTIQLGKDNALPTRVSIPIPPGLLKDHNTLAYQVDQHYTYKCEDPFSAELWTTVLPETTLRLNYDLERVKPDLAAFPFPLLDPLNTYTPTSVGYIVPTTASDDSLAAFGTVAVRLGQLAGWRSLKPYLTDESGLGSNDNLILIGTPAENPAIASLGGSLDLPVSGTQFTDRSGSPIPDDHGVVQLVPNPRNPTRAILIVSGNSPAGVKKAARVLSQNVLNKILVGRSAVIKDYTPGSEYPYRAWEGFIQHSGDTFSQLGLETKTTRGITALPLTYNIKMMPDIYLPGRQYGKLRTVYSYASQLDGVQSKLEVRWNGKAIKSVNLNDRNGRSLTELVIDIPTEDIHTYNDLEYQFHLYPDKYDMCRFVTDVHIWGTVHNTTSVEFPGEVKAALPDVGLLNDGGYPFTAYQDLSQVSMVLSDNPTPFDLETMLQFLTREGRVSQSMKGIELDVHHAGTLPGDVKGKHHLIVIGMKGQNKLLDELKGKSSLMTSGQFNTLREQYGDNKKLAEIQYSPDQGILEEMLNPWNDKRVALLITGETDTSMFRNAQLFKSDEWFAEIKPGNLTVINDFGPSSLILMKRGEARFFYPGDLKEGFQLPTWAWIVIGFFAVLGLFSVLRFLFGR